MMMKFLKNQKGVSLIGVITAGGLLGLLSVGIMKIMSGAYKQDRDLRNRQEVREFKQLMTFILNSNCGLGAAPTTVVNTATDSPVTLASLSDKAGNLITPPKQYGALTIEEISIRPLPSNDTVFSAFPKTAGGYASLDDGSKVGKINFKLTSGVVGINKFEKNSSQDIIFNINAVTNRVTDCRRLNDIANAEEACDSIQDNDLISADWDDEELKCIIDIEIPDNSGGAGALSATDPGTNTDNVLSNIIN